MEHRETLPRRGISRKEMLKRVARFRRLKGSDGGLPDSTMPGCKRKLEHVDLEPLDLISFPPGVIRRFENVTKGSKNKESILMVVIAGDTPSSEFTVESMKEIERAGLMPSRHRQ